VAQREDKREGRVRHHRPNTRAWREDQREEHQDDQREAQRPASLCRPYSIAWSQTDHYDRAE
jgi:hypothetical protein